MILYILLFVAILIISLGAQWHVKATFAKYSQVAASSNVTGAEVAHAILQRAGIEDVEIVQQNELLGDHYDPVNRRLVLSYDTFRGRSLAALGIAAHECGHAIQHKLGYGPLHWRTAAVGAVNFVNPMLSFLPLLWFIGLVRGPTMMLFMAMGYGVIMLFNLITLPVEFDASDRAKEILVGMGFIGTPEEITGVRKTLDAAGWTYVAAFVVTLLSFLYYVLPLLLGGRSRD